MEEISGTCGIRATQKIMTAKGQERSALANSNILSARQDEAFLRFIKIRKGSIPAYIMLKACQAQVKI